MKKILFLSMLVLSIAILVGFSSCHPKNDKQDMTASVLNVENCISTDCEQMSLQYGQEKSQAYERLMATNYVKPHSRHCVTREMVGEVPCNPKYIFGNLEAQICVDVVTGDVTDTHPAFKDVDGSDGGLPLNP